MNKFVAPAILALFFLGLAFFVTYSSEESFLGLAFFATSSSTPTAIAQRPVPPNDPHRGLIYDGLEPSDGGACKGGFRIKTNGNGETHILCTHGPDPAPDDLSVALAVSPRGVASSTSSPSPIPCDGDGVSGYRIQVIYAHASNVADRYATYASSFQQWLAGVDTIFKNSAAQTSGTRHLRFVADASCQPVIPDVTLTTTGDDTFANTINELRAKGYNRTDRKYLVLTDSNIYCGISVVINDDQPGAGNANNLGNTFSRVDSGCWSDVLIAHEMAHQFGAVQFSAPHSDGNWHCYDGNDLMCNYSGHAVQIVCSAAGAGSILDCNHDDYFTTKPMAGSYLASHWNIANNQFLISITAPSPTPSPTATAKPTTTPSPTATAKPTTTPKPSPTPTLVKSVRIDSILTGKLVKNVFTAYTTFARGDTAVMQAHAVDQSSANLNGVSISLKVNRPDGSTQCSLSGITDSSGNAQVSCAIPTTAPTGAWNIQILSFSKSGYTSNTSQSVMNKPLTVQ